MKWHDERTVKAQFLHCPFLWQYVGYNSIDASKPVYLETVNEKKKNGKMVINTEQKTVGKTKNSDKCRTFFKKRIIITLLKKRLFKEKAMENNKMK